MILLCYKKYTDEALPMVLCFTCSAATKTTLDRLIAAGHYPDHSEAIAAAVTNLAVLHAEMEQVSSIVISNADGVPSSANRHARVEGREEPTKRDDRQDLGIVSRVVSAESRRRNELPQIFLQPEAVEPSPEGILPVSSDQIPERGTIQIDRWLFGQYNRLLPVKVTCRALANLLLSDRIRLPLDKLAIEIASEAVEVGKYLAKLDARRNLGRDDALAVAFPKDSSSDAFKSVRRFASQFVGSTNNDGHLLGMPATLKLVGLAGHNLALTEVGWKFGLLANPLLDGEQAGRLDKFTDDEISLLIRHIVEFVPVEAFAYRAVLGEIAAGSTTPDSLDKALADLSRPGREAGDSFISTQRSGVIARMADLDLVTRSRSGTRVSYLLTPRGAIFLNTRAD
jgi:hypothetical protein